MSIFHLLKDVGRGSGIRVIIIVFVEKGMSETIFCYSSVNVTIYKVHV